MVGKTNLYSGSLQSPGHNTMLYFSSRYKKVMKNSYYLTIEIDEIEFKIINEDVISILWDFEIGMWNRRNYRVYMVLRIEQNKRCLFVEIP